jgi:hypothetical protein
MIDGRQAIYQADAIFFLFIIKFFTLVSEMNGLEVKQAGPL